MKTWIDKHKKVCEAATSDDTGTTLTREALQDAVKEEQENDYRVDSCPCLKCQEKLKQIKEALYETK